MADDRRSRFPVILIAAVVVVLPTLYFLSVGPIGWLVNNEFIDADSGFGTVLEAIYTPLEAVAEFCPPFEWLIGRYLELWE
jgi:hypothetical protein